MEERQKLYDYLKSFLTEERLAKIEHYATQSSDFVLPVMEDIYQFRNAAAIVRSVEACGFHRIVAMQDRNNFKPEYKVARGADTWVQVDRVERNVEALQNLRAEGYRIVVVSPEKNATALPDFGIAAPTALLFGTEWQGVSDEILDACDETLMIPMYGFTKSFNVSVAAGICMYELKQKLLRSGIDHLLDEEKQLELKIRWAVNSIRSGEEVLSHYLSNNSTVH